MSWLLKFCTLLRILWLLSWYRRRWGSGWWPTCVLVPNFVLVSRCLWISNCSGDRNVHCLSLNSCYRLRVHWSSHWLEKFGAKFWRDLLAPFFKQTMRDRNLRPSFVISFWYSQNKHWIFLAVNTKNLNKVLWWILFKILSKFDKRLY